MDSEDKNEKLTNLDNEITSLRLYKGLEHLTDEQAIELANSIRTLAEIVIQFCLENKNAA